MEKNILGLVSIALLIVVIGLLLFQNHQIDTIKHAVGVEESEFEEALHDELSEELEGAQEPPEQAGE